MSETVGNWETESEVRGVDDQNLLGEPTPPAVDDLQHYSREELLVLNMKLTTANQQLNRRVAEVEELNSDLSNLLDSSNVATLFLDRRLQLTRFTKPAAALFDLSKADIGRPVAQVVQALRDPLLLTDAATVLQSRKMVERELQAVDGRWFVVRASPYHALQEPFAGVVISLSDISGLKRAEYELSKRAKQRMKLAELGLLALQEASVDAVMLRATEGICEVLELEYCKVLQLSGDGSRLHLRQGSGWKAGYSGNASVPNDRGSQAGYTLLSATPVVVTDSTTEQRFVAPELLLEHRVQSGISTLIGSSDRHYGVLGAHSRSPRQFGEDEINFIQAIANLIGLVIERAELREERERLNSILEATPDLILTATKESGRIVYLNPAARAQFDYHGEPEQFAVSDYYGPEVIERAESEWMPIAIARGMWTGEASVRDTAGNLAPFSLVLVTHRDSDGNVEYVSAIGRQISEQKAIQAQLAAAMREAERNLAQLESIYHTAPAGLCFLTPELRYVHINQWLADINGVPVETHIGRTVAEVLPSLYDALEPHLTQVLATGEPVRDIELVGRTQPDQINERIFLVTFFPVRDGAAAVIGINVFVYEITELRRAQAQLEYQAFLLHNVRDAVVATDSERRITAWNQAAEAMYGWREDEVLGRSAGEILRSSLSSEEQERAIYLLQTEGTYQIETVLYDRAGNPIDTEGVTAKLVDGEARLLGYISVNRDISARKAVERRLLERERELRQLNESLERRVELRTQELARTVQELDQFAYITSHDLRTPLRAIDNLATWVISDASDGLPPQSQRHLRMLKGRVGRLENLLDDLLEYSRIGRVRTPLEPVHLQKLIEEIVSEIPRPGSFAVIVDADLPEFTAQRVPLAVVVRNLVTNAIRHHDREDGRVEIGAKLVDYELVVRQTAIDGPALQRTTAEASASAQQRTNDKELVVRQTAIDGPALPRTTAEASASAQQRTNDKELVVRQTAIDGPALQRTTAEASASAQQRTNDKELVVRQTAIDGPALQRTTAEASASAQQRTNDKVLVIRIRDDGPGIEARFHEQIFQVLKTLQPRDRTEGSGLGLSIVQKIVENHGGSIYVDSQAGEGAIFEVVWPLNAIDTEQDAVGNRNDA